MEVNARHHGHHHTVNVKYGYIAFALTIIYALVLAVSSHLYLTRWCANGKSQPSSWLARLSSIGAVWKHILIWSVILASLSFFHVNNLQENYTTVVKRTGRLGFCLIPFDILLVLRPNILGPSYLSFVDLHKWLSRLMFVLFLVHGVGFFCKWFLEGTLIEKSLKFKNFLGVFPFLLGFGLAIISLRPLREKFYKYFYFWHNVTVLAFVSMIMFHARPGITDVIILCWFMLAFQVVVRLRSTFSVPEVSVSERKDSSLAVLRFSKPSDFPTSWQPGAHIRLSYAFSNIRFWLFPSHPFTVFTLPADRNIELVIKRGKSFNPDMASSYTITAPYPSLPYPFFETADKVVILCGGSGISLGIPIFRYLKGLPNVSTSLNWCTANKNDAFVLNELAPSPPIDIYVTKSQDSIGSAPMTSEQNDALLHSTEEFEMETLNEEEERSVDGKASPKENTQIKFHSNRPEFDVIFSSLLIQEDQSNHWIIVCGPDSMISDVRKWGEINKIQVYSEMYRF